ncbi:hypothetical protein [Candidatus Binatus sp.]|jgi:hypothetical protein|uniref:hypothetical protein n=1 Tax=Candidatus Binatus sp. TaxID=2811406 RepID=UPI003CC511EA
MTKVFIAGSRKISKLSVEVRQRLDEIVAKSLPVVIGDASGVDKSVQQYLHAKGYRAVEVFCSGTRCRNNVGDWPTVEVAVNSSRRDFDFYATKDVRMSDEASFGLMIWDGESAGTLMNVLRLINRNKSVVVFEAPKGRFRELKEESEWNSFFSECSDEVRGRIEKLSTSDSKVATPVQASLL